MTTYQRAVDLMEAELGEEIVGLDARAGLCFGFNEVASSVWRALDRPQSFEALRDRLLAEYDVSRDQCEDELASLLSDLTAKGLINAAVA